MPDDLSERLRAFAEQQGPPTLHAEFEIALLVSCCIDASCDATHTRAALDAVLAQLDPHKTPWDNLKALRFCGNKEHYEAIDNSAIHRVLETRTGIPISLAVVLIEAARAQGYDAVGLNQPGHFLVRVEQTVIDPFALAPMTTPPAETETLAPITPVAFGLRMLNNLKYGFARDEVWEQALAMVTHQLALAPNHAQLLCEKGDYWAKLGGYGAAAEAYRTALQQSAADDELQQKLAARLQRLPSANEETLH